MEKVAQMFGYADVESFAEEMRLSSPMSVATAMMNAGMPIPDDATLARLADEINKTIEAWEQGE